MAHEALTLCAPHRPLGTLAEDRAQQVTCLPDNPEQAMLQGQGTDRECWGGMTGGWRGGGSLESGQARRRRRALGKTQTPAGVGLLSLGVSVVAAEVGSSDETAVLGRLTGKDYRGRPESEKSVRPLWKRPRL